MYTGTTDTDGEGRFKFNLAFDHHPACVYASGDREYPHKLRNDVLELHDCNNFVIFPKRTNS